MKHSHEYHFVTHWRLHASPEEVYNILDKPQELVRWWPSVYQQVEVTGYDEQKKANRYTLLTKGWLPYQLRWEFHTTEKNPHQKLSLEAQGDFIGTGVWRFIPAHDFVDVTYDWRIRAEKPLLRYMSFLLKPLFSANHYWAMAQGKKSLELELARRRAKSEEERATIPAPPPPVSDEPFILAALFLGLGLVATAWKRIS
jgi:hypothetical protein